jgi:hypothetical protein
MKRVKRQSYRDYMTKLSNVVTKLRNAGKYADDDQIKMTFTSTTRDFISTYLYPKPEQMLDEAASRGTARRPVRVK